VRIESKKGKSGSTKMGHHARAIERKKGKKRAALGESSFSNLKVRKRESGHQRVPGNTLGGDERRYRHASFRRREGKAGPASKYESDLRGLPAKAANQIRLGGTRTRTRGACKIGVEGSRYKERSHKSHRKRKGRGEMGQEQEREKPEIGGPWTPRDGGRKDSKCFTGALGKKTDSQKA